MSTWFLESELSTCLVFVHICSWLIYNDIWTTIVGELKFAREANNAKDRYVVSILQSSDIVRYLLQKISSLFL